MASQTRLPEPLVLTGNIAENWKRFRQEFEIYLLSSEKNEKKDEVKIALLLNCGGRELLDVYNTIPLDEDDKKVYKTLMEKFQGHFEPKKNVTYERYIFNSRTQLVEETIDSFVTDLRKKATKCEFGTLKDEMIRDRIICGINDDRLRGRLLRKGDATLDEVVLQCRAHEASEEQMKEFGASVSSLNVNTVKPSKKSDQPTASSSTPQRRCKFCGFRHTFGRVHCPASNKQCIKCGKTGHFKSRCETYTATQKRQESVPGW